MATAPCMPVRHLTHLALACSGSKDDCRQSRLRTALSVSSCLLSGIAGYRHRDRRPRLDHKDMACSGQVEPRSAEDAASVLNALVMGPSPSLQDRDRGRQRGLIMFVDKARPCSYSSSEVSWTLLATGYVLLVCPDAHKEKLTGTIGNGDTPSEVDRVQFAH